MKPQAMRIERVSPEHMDGLTPAERKSLLIGWHRVVDSDGSTIAYAPDGFTAYKILDAITRGQK